MIYYYIYTNFRVNINFVALLELPLPDASREIPEERVAEMFTPLGKLKLASRLVP
jgi:hypothetical protein